MSLDKFEKLFSVKKPIIGMIHLAGKKEEKVERALEELIIYQEEGVNGAIIEDYHGTYDDIYRTLEKTSKLNLNIILGVNVLIDPYSSFELADSFGAKFVQFDSVQTKDLNLIRYEQIRNSYLNMFVLGGVGFKYISPTGNPLKLDLKEAMPRCDAIVTTGTETGIETPIEKLKQYKNIIGDFPLVVGAGVNIDNAREQLKIADGAIIGTYLKPSRGPQKVYSAYSTYFKVERKNVKDLMNIVKDLREN